MEFLKRVNRVDLVSSSTEGENPRLDVDWSRGELEISLIDGVVRVTADVQAGIDDCLLPPEPEPDNIPTSRMLPYVNPAFLEPPDCMDDIFSEPEK